MGRPGVLFRFELLDALEQLDPADAGRLFLGAMRYGKNGTLPAFQNPLLSVVWPFIKTAVDHDAETYDSKILQKRFAVYVREAKKAGLEPMAFEVWKQSADITRCQPISGDIHNHIHTQYHNHTQIQEQEHTQIQEQEHTQIQEQEHTQENTAAAPPALARDSRNMIFLDDVQYQSLVADLGEPELKRCIDYLSEYCAMHGKKYRDWGAAIRRCSREKWGPSTKKAGSAGVDFQPSAERIQKNNDWLDGFLAEQGEGGGADGG